MLLNFLYSDCALNAKIIECILIKNSVNDTTYTHTNLIMGLEGVIPELSSLSIAPAPTPAPPLPQAVEINFLSIDSSSDYDDYEDNVLPSQVDIRANAQWYFTAIENHRVAASVENNRIIRPETFTEGENPLILRVEGFVKGNQNINDNINDNIREHTFEADIKRYSCGDPAIAHLPRSDESCLHVMSYDTLYTIELGRTTERRGFVPQLRPVRFNYRPLLPFTVYASLLGLIIGEF
jgi:hypothetical protein